MELRPSEYRDPGQVVADVMCRQPLAAGDVVLALVRDPSTEQEVVTIRPLAADRWRDLDQYDRSRLLAEEAQAMPIPKWTPGEPPRHSIMTIVARFGWCLIGPAEAEWLIAWHYSNHLTHAYSGDLIMVTDHGWTDFMSGWGGHHPRLDPAELVPAEVRSRSG